MHGSMQNGAVINQAHQGGTLRLAFLSAVVSLVVSFATVAAPITLYNIYRAEDRFTNFGISMAIVTYSVGTMAGAGELAPRDSSSFRTASIRSSCQSILMVCGMPGGTITSEIFPPFQSTISLKAANPSLLPVVAWRTCPCSKETRAFSPRGPVNSSIEVARLMHFSWMISAT